MISLIVAHGDNLVIGKEGWMPWHLPDDLKMFKEKTLNHTIVMGRTTFEVMKKPLPKRKTIVVTNNKNYKFDHDDVKICHDLQSLLEEYKNKEEILFICGGAKLYTSVLSQVDDMWISLVDQHYEGDTFFPSYEKESFIVETKQKRNGFTLIHYVRK